MWLPDYMKCQEIAEKWNVKDTADHKGYVTKFEVDDNYISQFEVQTVGRSYHQELWIPADELENFNQHIIGTIQVIGEFFNKNNQKKICGDEI